MPRSVGLPKPGSASDCAACITNFAGPSSLHPPAKYWNKARRANRGRGQQSDALPERPSSTCPKPNNAIYTMKQPRTHESRLRPSVRGSTARLVLGAQPAAIRSHAVEHCVKLHQNVLRLRLVT